MTAIERIDAHYQEFIRQHPRFADTQYVLPAAKAENLRQMALANRQILALCNAGRNDYHFLNSCCDEFSHLFTGEVSVGQLFGAMHKDDLKHFVKAWEISFGFMEKLETDELMNYSLILECRLLDNKKIYRRVMFKYVMISEDDGERRGQVLLFMKPVDGAKTEYPSRGIYILDILKQKFVYEEKGTKFSKRELEIARYSQRGLTSEQIADILGIKHTTVNIHRYNITQKISVSNITFAAMYLHHMGVI